MWTDDTRILASSSKGQGGCDYNSGFTPFVCVTGWQLQLKTMLVILCALYEWALVLLGSFCELNILWVSCDSKLGLSQ